MPPLPVEAVLIFRWTKQVSQATYGRLSSKDGVTPATRYTKNYIQVSGDAAVVLDKLYPGALRGLHDPASTVDIEFAWPTGTETAKLSPHSGDETRIDLSWPGSGRAPAPWKLGGLSEPETTIPGDPTGITEDAADAALETVQADDLRPWLMAVKVTGDERLHARAYLEHPAAYPQLAHTDVGQLPSSLLTEIKQLPSAAQSGVWESSGTLPPKARAQALVERIQSALEKDPNVLLVGPPGTGKTVALEDLRAIEEHETTGLLFDSDRWHDAFLEGKDAGKVISLVFHPSYSYEDFVAGLVPESDTSGLKLVARPGPLISLAQWAARSDRRALLILDEFNRGPTAAIFGDTLALLDGSKRDAPPGQEGAHITRPFANSPMRVAAEFADQSGNQDVPPELRLPLNVQIVAALNSSDRSVAPLDAAMRRRFAILTVAPDIGVLAEHLGLSTVPKPDDAFSPAGDAPEQWSDDHVRELAVRLLSRLNDRISFVLSDDFLLGHALLWPLGGLDGDNLRAALCRAFSERIVATLRITFIDQDDLLAAVLNAGQPNAPISSGLARWTKPPAAVSDVSSDRLVVADVSALAWPEAARALLDCLG
jgi:5-methylcytosine-specific restriction protein B